MPDSPRNVRNSQATAALNQSVRRFRNTSGRTYSRLLTSVLVLFLIASSAFAYGEPTFEVIGELNGVREAEARIGGFERMFIIDNEWDLRRYGMLIPDLPHIDTSKHMLIVVLSWPTRPRSYSGLCTKDGTLRVEIMAAPPPQGGNGAYRPPKFLIAQTSAWDGPVSFFVNGQQHHSVLKGDALKSRSRELWMEIQRVHKGGEPTREQSLRYWRHSHFRHSNLSDDEVLSETAQYGIADRKSYFDFAFDELARIRPTPIVPELFAFAERLGQHDPAWYGLESALIATGGVSVVDGSKQLLQSASPLARRLGIGVLYTLGFPEFRNLARNALLDDDEPIVRQALWLLERIGFNDADVGYLLDAIELAEEDDFERFDVVTSMVYVLGELGAKAQGAIGTLERLTANGNLVVARAATEALAKIRSDLERVSKSTRGM